MAHVVQQTRGVALDAEVGRRGDRYEQNADAVADAVVRGRSAESILDRISPTSTCACGGTCGRCSAAVQLDEEETEEEEKTVETLPPWPDPYGALTADQMCGGKCVSDADIEAYLQPSLLAKRAAQYGPKARWNACLKDGPCWEGTTFREGFYAGVRAQWFYPDEEEDVEIAIGLKAKREKRAKQAKVKAEIDQYNNWVAQGHANRDFVNSPGMVGWVACTVAGEDFESARRCGDWVNLGASVRGTVRGLPPVRLPVRTPAPPAPSTVTTKPTTAATTTSTPAPKPTTVPKPPAAPKPAPVTTPAPAVPKQAKAKKPTAPAGPNPNKPDDPRTAAEAQQDPRELRRYKKRKRGHKTFESWWENHGKKWHPNRYGAKGDPEHQATVERLVQRAMAEFPDDIIHREKDPINGRKTPDGRTIRKVKRKPDVWVEDATTGAVKKIYEAARVNDDGTLTAREKQKKKQYDALGLDSHFEKVPEPSTPPPVTSPPTPDVDPEE